MNGVDQGVSLMMLGMGMRLLVSKVQDLLLT